ncbi:hypothetical protein JCM17844_08970 [Iodidimonas gelatinilytica]|uniref:Uncharacterized protein n=1 Tax=Iodidimonas gelatinilytica TaxID=1236966 RepID=A0A5A7MMQ5_9PROT|nr:hypothetical protein [Iodidimonas gelatinilytica]GEQ97260.1 hypothetical protein JCM17844_08970 [Iodidimonas gelatinilytica]
MLAHLSYRAPGELDTRFGRGLQDRTQPAYGLEPDYQVESYLPIMAGVLWSVSILPAMW